MQGRLAVPVGEAKIARDNVIGEADVLQWQRIVEAHARAKRCPLSRARIQRQKQLRRIPRQVKQKEDQRHDAKQNQQGLQQAFGDVTQHTKSSAVEAAETGSPDAVLINAA